MKNINKTLLVGLLLGALLNAQSQTIRGARSCGKWVTERNGIEGQSTTWLVGFLSGMAAASSKDVLNGTDNPSLFLWMDNYCKANPLMDIDDGGNALFIALAKKKNL